MNFYLPSKRKTIYTYVYIYKTFYFSYAHGSPAPGTLLCFSPGHMPASFLSVWAGLPPCSHRPLSPSSFSCGRQLMLPTEFAPHLLIWSLFWSQQTFAERALYVGHSAGPRVERRVKLGSRGLEPEL